MPSNRMIETGAGFVAQSIIKAGPDGKLSDRSVVNVAVQLEAVRQAVNGRLSFGTGELASRAGNMDAQFRTIRFVTADEAVRVPHALGRVPVGFFVTLPDRSCNVYAMNLGGWGEEDFYVACDVAGSLVQLIVF